MDQEQKDILKRLWRLEENLGKCDLDIREVGPYPITLTINNTPYLCRDVAEVKIILEVVEQVNETWEGKSRDW